MILLDMPKVEKKRQKNILNKGIVIPNFFSEPKM